MFDVGLTLVWQGICAKPIWPPKNIFGGMGWHSMAEYAQILQEVEKEKKFKKKEI
jgi:hypothetical protein